MTRWIAAFPLMFACHKASVGLPPTFDGEALQVTDLHRAFSKTFTIGDTVVSDVHRGWTHGGSTGIGPVESEKARQKWSFTAETGPSWRGECGVEARETSLDTHGPLGSEGDMVLASSAVIACSLIPGEGLPWTLQITDAGAAEGWISGGDRQLRITETSALNDMGMHMAGTTGWVILEGNRPVAVVDVMNNGALWFAKDFAPEERAPVLAAAAAMLLYDDPRAS